MIYQGKYKNESDGLWKMRETPKTTIFESVSESKSFKNKLIVKKNQTGRWGYVRPLFEDSWIIYDNKFTNEYYEFDWAR